MRKWEANRSGEEGDEFDTSDGGGSPIAVIIGRSPSILAFADLVATTELSATLKLQLKAEGADAFMKSRCPVSPVN